MSKKRRDPSGEMYPDTLKNENMVAEICSTTTVENRFATTNPHVGNIEEDVPVVDYKQEI